VVDDAGVVLKSGASGAVRSTRQLQVTGDDSFIAASMERTAKTWLPSDSGAYIQSPTSQVR